MRKSALLSFLLLLAFGVSNTNAQIINTIAGSGTGTGTTFDSGLAVACELRGPSGVAVDNYGNVYFADDINSRIRKVSPAGIITTIAGNGYWGNSGDGGPAKAALMSGPCGLSMDHKGNLYFFDNVNYVLRKIDTFGVITRFAGSGSYGFVTDGVPATSTSLQYFNNIVFDRAGNAFLVSARQIFKIDTSGVIRWIAGNANPTAPLGDGGPATAAFLGYNVTAVLLDNSGNLYISHDFDSIAGIRKIDTNGIINTVYGNGTLYPGDGGAASAARFTAEALAMDTLGSIYFCQSDKKRIRKIDASGIITTIAGTGTGGFSGDGGPATAATLWGGGIALDKKGDVYFDDGNRIRKIYFSTVAIPDINTETAGINIFPNPATSELTITSTTNIKHIELFNPLGQRLLSKEFSTEKAELNIAALSTGIYFLKVNDTQVVRFVKL